MWHTSKMEWRNAVLTIVVFECLVAGAAATLQDGRPRPKNFADAPTADLGPDPTLYQNGVTVSCDWYGFRNLLYTVSIGDQCIEIAWSSLSNATLNPPSKLNPYRYYYFVDFVDPSNNQILCYVGCFNLGATAPSPALTPSDPRHDTLIFAPSTTEASPPTVTPSPTITLAPPPSDLTSPPPPASPLNPPPPPTPPTTPSTRTSSPPPPATTTSPPPPTTKSPPSPIRIIGAGSSIQPSALTYASFAGVLIFVLTLASS